MKNLNNTNTDSLIDTVLTENNADAYTCDDMTALLTDVSTHTVPVPVDSDVSDWRVTLHG